MKKYCVKLILVLLLLNADNFAFSQELNSPEKITLSTNVFKLFTGILNLEVQYHLSSNVSVFVFNEIIIWGDMYKKHNHPDYVFRTGGRYHYLKNSENHDINTGLFGGFTYSKNEKFKGFNAGFDSGYRYNFGEGYFIYPRALLTYEIKQTKLLPGIECLLGKVFN